MTTNQQSTDWAWVSGFFDGEGCIHFDQGNGQISLIINQVSELPMIKLSEITGIPYRGPFKRSVNQPFYTWTVFKNSEVIRIIGEMLPYLTLKKITALEKLSMRDDWKQQSDAKRIENRKQKISNLNDVQVSNCTKCKVLKPITQFNKNRSRVLGIDHYCKACKKIVQRKRKEEL